MFLINTPSPIHCYVRNEYLHNLESGQGKITEAYLIALRCIPGRAFGCQLVLKNGAQWAEIPLNALMHQPGAPHHPLGYVQPWDCFSHQACAVVLDYLRSMRVRVMPDGKPPVYGRYLFTVDWAGSGFAEVPEQHKNHHVIALEDGSFVAYPNNRTVWHDACWIEPLDKNPGYINNFHAWSGEYEDLKA